MFYNLFACAKLLFQAYLNQGCISHFYCPMSPYPKDQPLSIAALTKSVALSTAQGQC
jgi:hypothetical protein